MNELIMEDTTLENILCVFPAAICDYCLQMEHRLEPLLYFFPLLVKLLLYFFPLGGGVDMKQFPASNYMHSSPEDD